MWLGSSTLAFLSADDSSFPLKSVSENRYGFTRPLLNTFLATAFDWSIVRTFLSIYLLFTYCLLLGSFLAPTFS